MTRNGRIARLPLAIRQQLNEGLHEGRQGKKLVAWLNSLAEVQMVMAAQFGGEPIAEYNLSRWKKGGYRSWEEEHSTREAAAAMLQESAGLQETVDAGLANRMALILTANMAVELRRLDSIREGSKKSKRQRDLLNRFLALRRGNLEAEKIRIDRQKLDWQTTLVNCARWR